MPVLAKMNIVVMLAAQLLLQHKIPSPVLETNWFNLVQVACSPEQSNMLKPPAGTTTH